ncbi:DUF5682 family protein [Photobacterium sp. J15]|uniref:DUF5682 family protein n=1 Tax=Photobacterium sp. J15 TaxID=265901 RepID=UPI0007E48220|nr:DUF5682 family protein [Photobacterium sp. J15]
MPDANKMALEALNGNPSLIWAPVRHHSPICSWQLLRLIKRHKPDVILIETPADAQSLIAYLQSSETKPPVAAYMYSIAKDTQARRGFIPFAPMSPEWNALQAGKLHNIPCQFIDLPYTHWPIQLGEDEDEEISNTDPLLYDSEATFSQTYIEALLAQSRCESFDQWWDRYFEHQYSASAESFFEQMQLFGSQMRQHQTDAEPHTLLREQYMASRIAPCLAAGQKVLVVCGAFHCQGIWHFLQQEQPLNLEPERDQRSGCHLVPYPLSRLSHRHYGASLSHSGYYAHWWKKLKTAPLKKLGTLTRHVHTELATELMSFLTSKGHNVAMPQCVDLVVAAEQLAQLRDIAPGRSEFIEAAQLTFIKETQHAFHAWIDEFFTESKAGSLAKNLPTAPIVIDFRERSSQLKLPSQLIDGETRKELAIYRQANHLRQSHFLHQLAFLSVPYATQLGGPNFADQSELQRVREQWLIRFSPETESALVEQSHLGSTIEEVIHNTLRQRLNRSDITSYQSVTLLLAALQMGMPNWLSPLLTLVKRQIDSETDLTQLYPSLSLLFQCLSGNRLLAHSHQHEFEQVIQHSFVRLCARLPRLVDPRHEKELLPLLAELLKLTQQRADICQPSYLQDALIAIPASQYTHALHGACAAIATVLSQADNSPILGDALQTVIEQCHREPDALGDFCYGIAIAADYLLYQQANLKQQLDQFLTSCDETLFLQVLPAMRRGFLQLNYDAFAKISELCQQNPVQIASERQPDACDIALMQQIRQHALQGLEFWGIDYE